MKQFSGLCVREKRETKMTAVQRNKSWPHFFFMFKLFYILQSSAFDFLVLCTIPEQKPFFCATTSRGQFHQHFMNSFYACRSQKCKKTVRSSSFLHFWYMCAKTLSINTLMKLPPGVRGQLLWPGKPVIDRVSCFVWLRYPKPRS